MSARLAVQEQIDDALGGLDPNHRAVVALYYLLDMPLTEVAASLGIPLGTAKSRLHYGLAAMRSAALRDPEATTAQVPGGQPA